MPRTILPALALALLFAAACDDSSGPEVGLDAFVGTYALEPGVQLDCTLGDFGDAWVRVDEIEVRDASADSLFLRVPVRVGSALTGEIDTDTELEFALAVTGEDGFAGDAPVSISVPAGVTTVNGEGDVALDGEFTSDDTFSATISADLNAWLGGGQPTPCTPIDIDVIGTRE